MPGDLTKQEVYVTELAGPDDRWVSVTDASRIGRRQEHTIRTWIAQGLLPVNPARVGINKRTRQVRLSDLARLTPILDPDAGIATDLGTLDLPSIPKQQQQVMEQMTSLREELAGEVTRLGGRLHDLAGQHEQVAGEVREYWQVHQQQYQQLRNSLTEQATSYSQGLQQAREDLMTLVTETEQALRQTLSERVEHSEAAFRQALGAVQQAGAEATEQVRRNLEERLVRAVEAHKELAVMVNRLDAHVDQQVSQLVSRVAPLETTLHQLQGEIQKHVERMGQLEAELSGQIGQLTKQVAGLESTWQERATTAEQEVRQLRRDLDAQGSLQQVLQQRLDEERQAREELAKQVTKLLKPRQH